MKKRIFALAWLIAYLVFTLVALPLPCVRSHAEESAQYAYIHADNAYFYTAQNENSGLFVLPKTYFVKLLSTQSDYCRIEYLYDSEYTQKLTGYAKTSDITPVDFIPNEPYLYFLFDARYTVDGSSAEEDGFLDQITLTCAYYGDYPIGSKTYCYVLREGSFGYIPKPVDLCYAENHEYADYQNSLSAPVDTPDAAEEGAEGMSAAQIALLITLCLLVPLLAALVLKSAKKHPYDTDEET